MGTLQRSALKAEFSISNTEKRLRGLVKTLYALDPLPTQSGQPGAAFIFLNSAFKPAAEYDGMLGSMMIDGALSGLFTGAANDNGALSYLSQNTADIATEGLSEYLEYKARKAERGQGTYALGEHKTICNQFNETTDDVSAQSVKIRRNIEQTIAGLSQSLSAAKRDVYDYAYC